jgi:glycosyltransferase involved in cell wall biosynthesis
MLPCVEPAEIRCAGRTAALLSGRRIVYVALSARGGTALYSAALADKIGAYASVLYVAPEHLARPLRPATAEFLGVKAGLSHMETALRSVNVAQYLRVARYIREFRPDIVHFPLSHPWNFLLACGLDRMAPIVFTIHDPLMHSGAKWKTVVGITDKIMRLRSSRLVVLCRYSYRMLPPAEMPFATVIPHPPFEHYRRERLPDRQGRRKALFFGRFEKYKGLDVLCDAARLLHAQGWPGEIVVAGPGKLPKCFRGLSAGIVTVINRWLTEDEAAELLASADVLVLPYRDATQSGVLSAGYAAGLPVIASRVGSFPEFVTHYESGLLFDVGDSGALADSIRMVTTDDRLRARLRRGAETVAQHFSWDSAAEEHAELYASVIEAHARYRQVSNRS